MDAYGDTYDIWAKTIENPLTYGLMFMLGFCLCYCCYDTFRKKREVSSRESIAVDIYGYLAIALAKLHNKNKIKAARERVENGVGVGTDPDNIQEWVNEMWYIQQRDPAAKFNRAEITSLVVRTMREAKQ